jgi:sugar lactone lactonase YvrE
MDMVSKRNARGDGFAGIRLLAAVGAVMVLIAAGVMGCGSSSSTAIAPFAGVWVANGGVGRVSHFSGTELNASGSFNAGPVTVVNSTVLVSPQDTVFDSGGNMFVVDGGLNNGKGTNAAVYEFTASQLTSLNTTSNPVPAFTISLIGGTVPFNFPQFGAFDGAGNLWVADSGNSVVYKFTAAQLAGLTGVGITPNAVLVSPTDFNGTLGIAFDGSGNLWVDNNGGTTIVEITAATLAAASGVTPVTANTTLNGQPIAPGSTLLTINNPWGILFNSSGDMWITNEELNVSSCSGTVIEFPSSQISGGGSLTPTPSVVLTQTSISGTQSLCDPNGLSLSTSLGNLVVANAAGPSLAEFKADQLTTGSPAPGLFFFGAATLLNMPAGLTYGPLSLQ